MQSIATLVVALSCCYMLWCILDVRNIRIRMAKKADEFDGDTAHFVAELEKDRQYFADERQRVEQLGRLPWNQR